MSALLARRLANHRLVGPRHATCGEAVAVAGCVQAQDYRGALWAVAQRVEGATEATVERALAAGEILRTWPMRGTLHFVARADARWITRLLAPRIVARSARRHAELGLDAATFAKARTLLERALAGGAHLTRDECYAALARGGVAPEGQRGIHVLGRLAMDGVLCLAAPRGKQQAFALLDAWVPPAQTAAQDAFAGEAGLAELARRYAAGHGPATADDFAWWTGLSLGEARRALEASGATARTLDGRAYRDGPGRLPRVVPRSAHLLPAYDEYTVAYRDRGAFLDPAHAERTRNGIMAPVILLDGRIAGTWGRAVKAARVTVTVELFARPSAAHEALVAAEVARYGAFLGVPAVLSSARSRPSAGTSGSARRDRRRARR